MATYSIDLGVNLAVTGTAPGTLTNPRPLQIGLCKGTLDEQTGAFLPEQISSFRELLSRDQLIVRIFDITENPATQPQTLLAPIFLRLSCRTPTGAQTPDPWKVSGSPSFKTAREEASPCFASAAKQSFPCFRQIDTAGAGYPPVIYRVIDVDTPTTYLLNVLLNTFLLERVELKQGLLKGAVDSSFYLSPYYGTDPEMVIGPYG